MTFDTSFDAFDPRGHTADLPPCVRHVRQLLICKYPAALPLGTFPVEISARILGVFIPEFEGGFVNLEKGVKLAWDYSEINKSEFCFRLVFRFLFVSFCR